MSKTFWILLTIVFAGAGGFYYWTRTIKTTPEKDYGYYISTNNSNFVDMKFFIEQAGERTLPQCMKEKGYKIEVYFCYKMVGEYTGDAGILNHYCSAIICDTYHKKYVTDIWYSTKEEALKNAENKAHELLYPQKEEDESFIKTYPPIQ